MSTTTTITATTATDLLVHCTALKAQLGGNAYVSIGVSTTGADALVSIYPHGVSIGAASYMRDPTWEGAIAKAYEWVAGYGAIVRNNVVRRMALAIIDITDEHGACPFARLIGGDKFTTADIETFGRAACERASEMCGNAPFAIT